MKRSESGNVTIAVIVMVVGVVVVTTTIASVLSGLNQARTTQNRINAFQFANAGVDQALYRIDAGQLPASSLGTYVPTVSGGRVTGFSEQVTVGTSTFTVAASQDVAGVPGNWTVRSTGADISGRRRTVVASVQASALFTNAFFTLQQFTLTGTQTSPRWFQSTQCTTLSNVAACELPLPVGGRLGANGNIDGSGVAHFASEWAGFTMYGRSTQQAANAACGTCPSGQVSYSTNALTVPVPPVPTGAQSCPSGGSIGTATIQPGDYLCNSLNITGTMTVGTAGNGTGIVRFWINSGAGGLSVSGVVNKNKPTKNVQFYMAPLANGSAQSGSICGSEIWALMYTPGLSIACNGSHQPEVYGAVIAHDYQGTGNHFGFHYDSDAPGAASNGRYVVSNWRECPVNATTC